MGETVRLRLITDGTMMSEDSSKTESKRGHEFIEGDAKTESKRGHEFIEGDAKMEAFPSKKLLKGGLNDESNSEVLNPNVPPLEDGASSETVSSQIADRSSKYVRRENPSTGSWKSGAEFTDNDEQCIDDSVTDVPMKSEVVLEAPKPVGAGGIRRIILKFSKSKSNGKSLACPSTMEVDSGRSYNHFHTECTMKPLESADSRANMLLGTSGSENQLHCSPTQRMELKMPQKIFLNGYPSSVKKLLSTGILEGVPVKYVAQEKELLRGVIKDIGYMCGCSFCNFTRVVNAFEFEQHAGCKTRHPNNHIFFENGKSIYGVVQELRSIPLNSLDRVIQTVVGGPVNEKLYLAWKELYEACQSASLLDGEESRIRKHPHQWVQQSANSLRSYHSEAMVKASSFSVQKSRVKKESFRTHKAHKENSLVSKLSIDTFNLVAIQQNVNSDKAKKRDNDLHRLLFMPNGLPDGAELAYYSKGKRLLRGYKQGNGIVCSCCNNEVSPSTFEAHAGWATRRQPYRHIYTTDGVSLHDLSISLANGRSLTGGNSNDTCTVCGDGGDMIFCSRCPRAFHGGCLELQCTPERGWNCPYCKDKMEVGGKACNESSGRIRRIIIRLTKVVKAPEAEIGGCAVCRAHDFSVSNFDERTVMLCDQCEKEYHVGCLRNRGLCDLKELPKGKWFCCDGCSRIHADLQKLFLCGARVIPPPLLSTMNRKLIEKGMPEELGNDVQWQLLSGKVGSLCDRSLLSRAAAIFRDCFDPIVETSGRDLIPAMVYGRNVAGQEFGGMYCAILCIKSVVVSAGVLRIFGQELAELPLVATTKRSQGKGYFQVLFSCIERLLWHLNVKNIVLPAAEEAESMWMKKFGFQKMTQNSFQKYTREFQVMTFKGTSMLEKEVPQMTDEQTP